MQRTQDDQTIFKIATKEIFDYKSAEIIGIISGAPTSTLVINSNFN